MQLPTVELQADDGKHEDGKEEQEADLQERHHGLHDGLQHNLQAWGRDENSRWSLAQHHLTEQAASPLPGGEGPVLEMRTTGPEMTEAVLNGASQTLPLPPPQGPGPFLILTLIFYIPVTLPTFVSSLLSSRFLL